MIILKRYLFIHMYLEKIISRWKFIFLTATRTIDPSHARRHLQLPYQLFGMTHQASRMRVNLLYRRALMQDGSTRSIGQMRS